MCILMLLLLGRKGLRIGDKIGDVKEADRLYAAGDLIAAEELYRRAAENPAIRYHEEEISSRLQELDPITAIRSGLAALSLSVSEQLRTGDFAGFMESYASLVNLKGKYMVSGGPYEAYYRQLSAETDISGQITAGFKQFRQQFLAELAAGKAGAPEESSDDSYKWNLLQIPADYYGGADAKAELLAEQFASYDQSRLKALAAAGSFGPMLDRAWSMQQAYSDHSYKAPWLQEQADASAGLMLNKDLEGDLTAAFAAHAAAYRQYAATAGLEKSDVLSLIDSSIAKLVKNAGRLVRSGEYAAGIRLYSDLATLTDTGEQIKAAQVAWNLAEPVRLLPGGDQAGMYSHVTSAAELNGLQVAAAGTDSSGKLYYAGMSRDGTVSTMSGDIVLELDPLEQLAFERELSEASGLPVIMAESGGTEGRTAYNAYTVSQTGITPLLSFSGDSYEFDPVDRSIRVFNADLGDGSSGQTAIYRESAGVYQFSEVLQETPVIPVISAEELEQHPFETVSFSGDIYYDNAGRAVAGSAGRYVLLQGDFEYSVGQALITGQFQTGYEMADTELGSQFMPVFVVESIESLSVQLPDEGLSGEDGVDTAPEVLNENEVTHP
ncbi:hypothetical protein ['Paenibacillus yunnanensis' Narsing Rao et al. 2020]|uniref:hypothetical protein n=1 Tax=Paenibacillus tengchongensis TaxID=2608684 RepID=UPI0016528731|nr:hypothetical protein [Paenibacillus tengchongensis]